MNKIKATDYQLYLDERDTLNYYVDGMNSALNMIKEVYATYIMDRKFYNNLRKDMGVAEPINISTLTDSMLKELPFQTINNDAFNFFNKHSREIALITQMYEFSISNVMLDYKVIQQGYKDLATNCKFIYEHLMMIEERVSDFNLFIEDYNIKILNVKIPLPNALTTIIKAKVPKKQDEELYDQFCDELRKSSKNNVCTFIMSPLPLGEDINSSDSLKEFKKNNHGVFLNSTFKESDYEYEL